MDLRGALFLFKETRVNLEPSSATAAVHVRIPAPPGSSSRRGIRSSTSARLGTFAEDEKAYRNKSLATSSSIYRRLYHSTPRNFLWRVLEDGNVLSIQAADIYKPEAALDTSLVLHIHFPTPLRPSCIAFADPKEHDVLTVFALDEAFHLYHISLRPDVFRRRTATENGLQEACKPFLSNVFQFKQPQRLLAISSDKCAVTLNDGGIIVFDRKRAHETSDWTASLHSPISFKQGLRQMLPLPWNNGSSIKHEGTNLEITAAASAVTASMDLDDTKFLFTVCLDHRLRVWNMHKGEIIGITDILGMVRDTQEVGKWRIQASMGNLIRVLPISPGVCACAVFSPVGAGTFMFWTCTLMDDGRLRFEPYFDSRPLVPPPPSTSDVWTMADFGVLHTATGDLDLWVLWKNNLISRVMRLCCSTQDIDRAWAADWVGVVAETTAIAQDSSACDSTDSTEKWMQLIFQPGRFSHATLETALTMYERGLGASKGHIARTNQNLAECICAVLGSTAILEKGAQTNMDYDQFRSSNEVQWRRFYRLLIELDKQRGEALSMMVDDVSGLTWVVCADLVAAIRDCTALDRVYYNLSSPKADTQAVSNLLNASLTLTEDFSDSTLQQCTAALRPELFEDSSKTDQERLSYFADKAGFWRQITDDDCGRVLDILGENFKSVDLDAYRELLSLFDQPDSSSRDVEFPLTHWGQKVVVKAVQQSADLQWEILLSQLILLVHMEFEWDEEEDALHTRLDVGQIFRQMVANLARLDLVRRLSKSELDVGLSNIDRSALTGSVVATPSLIQKGSGEIRRATILEASAGHLLGFGEASVASTGARIAEIVADLCASNSSIELDPAIIQCMLLKRGHPELAQELSPSVRPEAFATYIQGRVCLSLQDFDAAASHFKRASIGLSASIPHAKRHSAGLIDDAEWNMFHSGLSNFYAHVISLYDRCKAYSHVVEFSDLALNFLDAQCSGDDSSPGRAEILSRLFTASTALSRFELAHTTLMAMTNQALRHSCTKGLVERMCDSGQTAELIALPFPGLQQAVDDVLQQKCDAVQEVSRGTQWHQILYSWRVHHNDYRGAATVILDRLRKLQHAGGSDRFIGDDVLDTAVTKQYLTLINTLSCVDPKQAWICIENSGDGMHSSVADVPHVVRSDQGEHANGGDEPISLLADLSRSKGQRRSVLTLADLRKMYQAELDRIAAIQNNQFDFMGEDEMDVS